MKKITLLLLGAAALFATTTDFVVPAAYAAPAVKGKQEKGPKENWSKLFKDGLFRADGKEVKVSALKKKKFIGIYSSASWCGPCRAFTPQLIKFYKENKNQIEIILVGFDNSQEAVFKYMNNPTHKQPWLTTKFGSLPIIDYRERSKIAGIPDFRVYRQDGTLLTNNGRNLAALKELMKKKK